MRRSRAPILATAVVFAAVFVVACGGGGGDGAGDAAGGRSTTVATEAPATTAAVTSAPVPATTAPPRTTAPATTVPATTVPATTVASATTGPATELDVATSALITIDDFVEGWVESPRQDDDAQDARTIALISDCAGVDAALIGEQVMGDTKAQSAEFSSPDGSFTVEHTVGFAADEATAAEAIAQIGDPDVPGCYGQAIATLFEEEAANPDPDDPLPPGLEIGDVVAETGDVSTLAPGAEAVWYHVVAPLTLDQQTIEQHVDIVFLRDGRVLSQVLLSGLGARFPSEDLVPIVDLAVERAAAIA